MMNTIKLINDRVLSFERNISCLFLFLVVSLVFTSAVLRTAGIPQAWMNDLAKLLFGWVIFFGADIALNKNKHIGVEYFEEKLPTSVRKIIKHVWSISIVLFLGFISYYGWILTEKSRRKFDSLHLSDFNLFICVSFIVITMIIIEEKINRKTNNYNLFRLLCFLSLLCGVFIYIFPLDKAPVPLSYSYLIFAVPIGSLLMIRTQLAKLF